MKLKIKYCPLCDNESVYIETKTVEFNIRNIPIEVTSDYHKCSNCKEEFTTSDNDPYKEVYRKYREMFDYIQPEEIKLQREMLGLTQRKFSELLGITPETLNRYERGSLQTKEHNELLKNVLQNKGNKIYYDE